MGETTKTTRLKGLYIHLLVRLFAVDLAIVIGLTTAWLAYLEVSDLGGTLALCVGAYVAHVFAWAAYLHWTMAPVRAWERGEGEQDDAKILAADRAMERLPTGFTVTYILSWPVYFGGVTALAWFLFPDTLSLGHSELVATAFQLSGTSLGAPVLTYPLTRLLLRDARAGLGAELERRSLQQSRVFTPTGTRQIVLAVCMAAGPVTWQIGTTSLVMGDGAREVTRLELHQAVREAARELDEGEVTLVSSHELVTPEQLPASLAIDGPGDAGDTYTVVDKHKELVTAAAAVGDGRWILARASVEFEWGRFVLGFIGLALAVVSWATLATSGTVRLLVAPLKWLNDGFERIIEVGDLRNIDRIPVAYEDEAGVLMHKFNKMLDLFDELAGAAHAVAEGDLRSSISGPGHLQDAFRSMVARLDEIVTQVRSAASELAGAAAEIHAATQGQEQAASQQADGAGEVSVAMQRLSQSAGDIASAAREVLSNAQQARERTTEAGSRLGELSGHVARVDELLELIREVANRSDLLALNGSLEATRAGEAGRGFALVAAEMRRLASRVTEAVSGVSTTVSAIEAASASTIVATKASLERTRHTADAAHLIVEVTQAQSAETMLVSASARDIAAIVSQSAAALTQTRASANHLSEQARQLEQLTAHFALRDPNT